jgi:hypothetical protein
MEATTKEGLKLSGKIRISSYQAGMVDAVTPYLNKIAEFKCHIAEGAPRAAYEPRIRVYSEVVEDIKARFFIRTAVECPNLIMDSAGYGLDIIIQRLVGINTYSGNILWIEIGTGSTTPTVNDTALTTPSVRAAVNFQEDYATTDAIVQAYITDANLTNATYTEVGGFIDGTATIGSGQIFNHALLSPTYTKVSGEDTTIQIDITVSNS